MTELIFNRPGGSRIDILDLAIIDYTKENQGVEFHDLVCVLGVPKTTAWSRLRDLERLGYLRLERGHKKLKCYPGDTR